MPQNTPTPRGASCLVVATQVKPSKLHAFLRQPSQAKHAAAAPTLTSLLLSTTRQEIGSLIISEQNATGLRVVQGQGQRKMRQRRRWRRSTRRRGIKRRRSSRRRRGASRDKVVEAATQLNDALRHVGATLRMCVWQLHCRRLPHSVPPPFFVSLFSSPFLLSSASFAVSIALGQKVQALFSFYFQPSRRGRGAEREREESNRFRLAACSCPSSE